MASWSLGGALRNMFASHSINENSWNTLEDALLGADFGAELSETLIAEVRAQAERYRMTDSRELTRALQDIIEERLIRFDPTLKLDTRPAVVLMVGINGVGKTTTIGKFANFLTQRGRSVVLGAADTFRAAAVEQLATWATRSGAGIVRPQQPGQDPASVAYQTVQLAVQENIDIALIDTAGRLHSKTGLMDELGKIRRVVEKLVPVAEVLLVLDATGGQNGLAQADAFLQHAGVSGLVLSKLDGTAKGGFVVAVQEKTGIPVKLVGQGEGLTDLTGFTPHVFAGALFSG